MIRRAWADVERAARAAYETFHGKNAACGWTDAPPGVRARWAAVVEVVLAHAPEKTISLADQQRSHDLTKQCDVVLALHEKDPQPPQRHDAYTEDD